MREKIKEQSIGRINRMREHNQSLTSDQRTYSLAQLRSIKNSKELFLKDKELERVLGIQKDQTIDEPILVQL